MAGVVAHHGFPLLLRHDVRASTRQTPNPVFCGSRPRICWPWELRYNNEIPGRPERLQRDGQAVLQALEGNPIALTPVEPTREKGLEIMTQEQRATIANDLRAIIFAGDKDEQTAGELIEAATKAGALAQTRYASLRQHIRDAKQKFPDTWGALVFDHAARDLHSCQRPYQKKHAACFLAGLIDGTTPTSHVRLPGQN